MRPALLRRCLPVALTAALLASVSACGSSGSGSATSGTLHVYMYQDASTKVQDAAVAKFNATSSVKVSLVRVPGTDYSNKLRAAMGSPNAPDIFFNWGGGSIRPYVQDGLLLDLTPTMNSDPAFKNAFIPSVLNAGKIDGKYYGIPMRGVQPVILFYNKTLFAQYHVQPPKTWQDLLHLVDVFKSAGITPFALGGSDSWPEEMWLEILVDRYGGSQVFSRIESGDQAGWDNPAILKAAQTARQLVDDGAFGNNYGSVSYVNGAASALIAHNRAAMQLMGSWEYSTQLSADPSFAKSDLGYVSFPTVPNQVGATTDVVGNPTNYFSINAHTRYKQAAISFLKTLSDTYYDNQLIADGEVPATTNAQSLLAKEPTPQYAAFEYDMVKQAPNFTLSWDQALESSIATPMDTDIQKLFAKQLSPAAFVSTVRNLS